jgi:hypothetical protein
MLLHNEKTDAALSSFETAAEKGYSVQMLAADPQLAALRGNAKFDNITGQAKSR